MKVCVVGAGPSGLTAVKQLLDEGHDVVCYDKNPGLGGIWLRTGDDGEQTKAFDNLHLTISMRLMAYSDHPFQGGRVFYSRERYYAYLREYADRFGLLDHIEPGSEVTDLTRTGRGWTVSVRRDGEMVDNVFDAVAICTGPFKSPNRAIPGLEGFAGEIVHSAEYRNNERFTGKRVLIVGLAESGADIVREIGEVSQTCTLAIRSYTFLLARIYHGTKTTDQSTTRSHHHEMMRRGTDHPSPYESFWGRSTLAKLFFLAATIAYGLASTALGVLGVLRDRITGRGNDSSRLNPFGQPVEPEKIDIDTIRTHENVDLIRTWNQRSHPGGSWAPRGIFCKNVSFIPSIATGKVQLNDAGLERAEGTKVFFKDGTAAEYDVVVLCTGYIRADLGIGDLRVADGNVRNLYRNFLHPDHDGTAAFIGYVRPFSGGIPICAEMQARYFARVCSGKQALPADLDKRVAREREWGEYWIEFSPRHTEAIPSQVLYLDALAREIGCLVPMWRMLLNPRLFIQLWFGSFNQSCYRLVGPHSLGAAARADLYSEPVDNRRFVAFFLPLLQLMPSSVHPKDYA